MCSYQPAHVKARGGGGIYARGDSYSNTNNIIMNIYNSSIINNVATGYNGVGGIYMHKSIGHIYGSNISNNECSSCIDGGMSIQYSDVSIKDTTISQNNGKSTYYYGNGDVTRGRGVYIYGTNYHPTSVNITRCIIKNNGKYHNLYLKSRVTVTIRETSFISTKGDLTYYGNQLYQLYGH